MYACSRLLISPCNCFPLLMFPGTYISLMYQYFSILMLFGTYIVPYLLLLYPCFVVPMFPGTYVSYLFFPIHVLPHTYVLWYLIVPHYLYSPSANKRKSWKMLSSPFKCFDANKKLLNYNAGIVTWITGTIKWNLYTGEHRWAPGELHVGGWSAVSLRLVKTQISLSQSAIRCHLWESQQTWRTPNISALETEELEFGFHQPFRRPPLNLIVSKQ